MKNLKSKRDEWDKYSAVRAKKGYMLSELEKNESYFPISRQPICSHEIIKSLGHKSVEYILVQSLYRNLHEIAEIETGFIYKNAIKVANNEKFPAEVSMDAFRVAIDEVYHAYLAADLIQQLKLQTSIDPLEFPTTQLESAIAQTKDLLPETTHDDFELIAVSITESLIGSDAGNLVKEKGIHKTIKEFTYDHMVDEIRHSRIFNTILKIHWEKMNQENKDSISSILPQFISLIFKEESQLSFDKSLLRELGLPDSEIKIVIDQIYNKGSSPTKDKDQKAVENILKFLDESGVYM